MTRIKDIAMIATIVMPYFIILIEVIIIFRRSYVSRKRYQQVIRP